MLQRARKLRTVSLASALVALVMISYGVITSALNTHKNLANFKKVTHTRDVLTALQKSLSAMQDLELGQRGYVIVGRDEYLQPYHSAQKVLDGYLGQLVELTEEHPLQRRRVGQLIDAANLKREYLARTIEVRRTIGEDEVEKMTRTGEGKALMDRFRAEITQLETEELKILENRKIQLNESLRQTNLIVAMTGGIAILSGAIGVAMLVLFFRNQQRLEKARTEKDKAVQSDQAKSEFLAMMSHEIRTPMNAILGFGELLEDSVETSRQKHYAKAILSSGNSLLLLINDILDLSKIEASKLDLRPELVDLRTFCSNLETLFEFRATEKGLKYSVEIDPDVPAVLTFDALRMRQIMVNLIGNALKFTNEGEVRVVVRVENREGDDRVWLSFDVKDTGIGIASDQLEQIFRPFYQVDSRSSRDFQGTGLGLNISDRLAKAMEGELSVVSELGKGSSFHIIIPTIRSSHLIQPDVESKSTADFNRLAPARILVADDVPLNRELIRSYLEGSHHEIYEAENGEQAVALCKKYQPDIALLDIRMPVMDGREARLHLKNWPETKHIPLIAISASSLLNSQAELKSLFDGFADKPLNRNRLFIELARFLPAAEIKDHPPTMEREIVPSVRDTVTDPLGLADALTALEDSPWQELVKVVPAQRTIVFSDQISALASKHGSVSLANYADQLRKAAETLDLETAGRLLNLYPQLVKTFSANDD
jgi:signal transduction histidine kinase/CheY-like chemotaxis protein